MKRFSNAIVVINIVLCQCVWGLVAQTTTFTYQGRLNDSGQLADGLYDMQFRVFDAPAGGAQQGSTVSLDDVQVTAGIFSVTLNFGSSIFSGADRFMEIEVRPGASIGAFTTLSPRQPLTSTPYALRSLNTGLADGLSAACVGCVTNTQIGSLPPGSGNYVQNTTTQQATSNFSISGNGAVGGTLSANTVNASGQYNLGGNRVLSVAGTNNTLAGVGAGAVNAGSGNSFFGRSAGLVNTTGASNSFFGYLAGAANSSGSSNSFFGRSAGAGNTTGGSNSFFGESAGGSNTSGSSNTFFGESAGVANTGGNNNSFFGRVAGASNSTGDDNAFFGTSAGTNNTTGVDNAFFGRSAGLLNSTGNRNSFFGRSAGAANATANDNSFFGNSAGAATTGSTNSFFGSSAGLENTSGASNSFFGASAGSLNTTATSNSFFGRLAGAGTTTGGLNSFVGATAGLANTTGFGNSFVGISAGESNTTGFDNSFFGRLAGESNTTGDNNTIIGSNADVGTGDLDHAAAIGAGAIVSTSNTIVLGRSGGQDEVVVPGPIFVGTLGAASSTHVCINAFTHLSTCSSSARYKEQVRPFRAGLDLLQRLRPVTFDWIATGEHDLGLVAEEVAKVEPLLITHNKKGEIEGVKYDQLNVVLINAIREQQELINALQKRLEHQEERLNRQEALARHQRTQLEKLASQTRSSRRSTKRGWGKAAHKM